MISHIKSHDIPSREHQSRAALAALCSLLAAGSLVSGGCSATLGSSSRDAGSLTFSIDDMDLEYTNRDQDPSYDESAATKIVLGAATKVAGDGATANGSDVAITQAGTYILSGTATDAQVLVDCADENAKVQLVLDGVSLTCSDGPAVYVKSADKCFVTLAADSKNTLADASGYTLTGDDGSEEPTAALFSKADLTLQGSGQLTVKGNCNNGIGSKDDLIITGGTYKITAANDGLRGRDCVKVLDGTFKINSAQDAVKSNNDEDTTRGFVKIDGGTWTIDAGDDAFHAETAFILNDGDVTVTSCYEGYEGVQIYLNGGTTNITASDDAINAASGNSSDAKNSDDRGKNFENGNLTGESSFQAPPAKPDGNSVGAGEDNDKKGDEAPSKPDASESSENDSNATPPDKPDENANSTEGSGQPSKPDKGNDQRPQNSGGQGGGGGGMDADGSCLIQINGGEITLDSGGDGIDSNGSVEVNGGNITVYGPTSGGDGALDYGTTASISGGTVIALGSKGMAASFTGGSQPYALVDISGNGGDSVTVSGPSGKKLLSTTATKSFETAVVSCSAMSAGNSYTITSGKSSATFTATAGN